MTLESPPTDQLVRSKNHKIARIDRPSRETFEKDFLRPGKPCVITNVMADWKAPSLWTADYLRKVIGNLDVPVTRTTGRSSTFTDDSSQVLTMKFGEFLDLNHETDSAEKYFLMQRKMDINLPDLLSDIALPELFDAKHLYLINYWHAPGPNVTLLHCDFLANLLSLVTGRKRLVLFPPGAKVYPHSVAGNFSRVNIERPDLERFPRFSRAEAIEVSLEAGEMLFIPGLWWHQVYSEPSIAVNFWWWPRGLGLMRTVVSRQFVEFSLKRYWNAGRNKIRPASNKATGY